MRKLRAIVLAALFVSCTTATTTPPPHVLQLTVEQASAWKHRQGINADLDGDGAEETVILASDVVMSDRGVPLWEDGHRWAVIVEDDGHRSIVYSAFVPNGFAEAAVLEPSGGRREVLIQERTPQQLRTLTIRYDGSGRASATSVVRHAVQTWFPGSARLP